MTLSCSRVPAPLREVASLVGEYPDSALTLLESLPRESLRSEKDRAEYDFLHAQAFYGTYFFLDDASSIALASAYRYQEQRRHRTGMLALLIAAILSTLVLYLWARKNQTERLLLLEKEESERMLSAAEDLRARLAALSSKNKPSIAGLDTLDRLCEQYYIYEGTENLQPKILKEVTSIVGGLRSDEKVRAQLEQTVNASCDDVIKRLRERFPKWKEEDFLLYLFTVSGFSSTTISTLLEKDKPYVYNRLYRLKERIRTAPDADFFLSYL